MWRAQSFDSFSSAGRTRLGITGAALAFFFAVLGFRVSFVPLSFEPMPKPSLLGDLRY